MATPPEALVVEQIAGFAARARPDSLGCALGALPGEPFVKLRQQFDAFGRGGRCTLIGGGQASPDQAALYNSGLVRYVDLLDSYMGLGAFATWRITSAAFWRPLTWSRRPARISCWPWP
jgi:hypothetical protein